MKHLIFELLAPFILAFAAACPPPLRARNYLSGPQIYFLHVTAPTIGGARFDQLQQLPTPCNGFFLVSLAPATDNIYLHLKPLGRSNPSGSAGITPIGNEEWFPLTTNGFQTGPNYWSFVRFKETVNQIYLSWDTGAGTAPTFTLACIQDNIVAVNGAMWT